MSIDKNSKLEIIKEFRIHESDTASCAVQIAILTKEISVLTEHLTIHKKDFHSRKGMMGKIELRRKLLKYFKKENPSAYADVIKKLGIRK